MEKRKRRQMPDMKAVNPYDRATKMSDVARALMGPKDPKVWEKLERARRERSEDQ